MANLIAHLWQSSPGSSWSSVATLPGGALDIVTATGSGHLDIVYIDYNMDLYHVTQTNNWSTPEPLHGRAQEVVLFSYPGGRLEVFYIGTNNQLYHNWQTGPNGPWQGEAALGGSAKQLVVGSNANGLLEVFYVGTNDKIYHNRQDPNGPGGWAGESEFGGTAEKLAVGSNQDGRLELFYVGTDGKIYHNWQTSPNSTSWGGENRAFSEAPGREIAVAANADGRLEVFYIGVDNKVRHIWEEGVNGQGGWSSWYEVSGISQTCDVGAATFSLLDIAESIFDPIVSLFAPSAVAAPSATVCTGAEKMSLALNADGQLELFYIGTDGRIYNTSTRLWSTGGSPIQLVAGQATRLSVGKNIDGRLELFYLGSLPLDPSNWMRDLNAQSGGAFFAQPFVNATFPASHDAGMSCTQCCTSLGGASNAQTQNLDTMGQLNAGIRYFDFRVTVWDVPSWSASSQPLRWGHFSSNGNLTQGCQGQDAAQSLQQIADFASSHPSEIIFVKVKPYGDNNDVPLTPEIQAAFVALVKSKLGSRLAPSAVGVQLGTVIMQSVINSGKNVICLLDAFNDALPDPGSGLLRWHNCSGGQDPRSNFEVYDSYAGTDQYKTMMSDQWNKLAQFGGDPSNYPAGRMFLLSWQLTQQLSWQSQDLLYDIRANANRINPMLGAFVWGHPRMPNFISIDAVDATHPVDAAVLCNVRRWWPR